MPANDLMIPGIPAKQLAINYLCDKSAEVDERYDREKNDNIAMILPVTTHLYIDSLEVEETYRNRGIATAMLDFIISMAVPESICLFAAKEDAQEAQVHGDPVAGQGCALEEALFLSQAPEAPRSLKGGHKPHGNQTTSHSPQNDQEPARPD